MFTLKQQRSTACAKWDNFKVHC